MAAKKERTSAIKNDSACDDRMCRLKELEIELTRLNADLDDEILEALKRYSDQLQDLQLQYNQNDSDLRHYLEAEQDRLFQFSKSIKMVFGELKRSEGTPSIVIDDPMKTVAALEKLGLNDAITVTRVPNKQVLKTFNDATLKKVFARREQSRSVNYKLRAEKLETKSAAA